MNRRTFATATAGFTLWPSLARPQAGAWPDRPVRLLLSQPAGSGADAMARLIADPLARRWRQQVIVENRPGGQNTIGAQAAARMPADGFNFYLATAAALVTNTYLFKSLPYDARKDFVPVGMVGKVPFALTVNHSLPVRDLRQFVAHAKAQPGKLTLANEGPKTFGGLLTRLAASQLGIDIVQVPYVSVGAAATGTIAGQSQALISDVGSVAELVKGGRLQPVAVTTSKRFAAWEGVGTFSDLLPDFDFAGWIGVVAPAGTPAAAVQRFNRDLDAVLADPELAGRLQTLGPVTEGAGAPAQMAAFLEDEHRRWERLGKTIGLLPE